MVSKPSKAIINNLQAISPFKYAFKWRVYFIVLWLLSIQFSAFPNKVFNSEFPPIVLNEPDTFFTIDIMDFSWIKYNSENDISDLFQDKEQLKNATTERNLQPRAALWTVLGFENISLNDLSKHIEFNYFADEIEVFFMEEGEVVRKILSGKNLSPPEKPFHSTNNYIPINIAAGKIVTIVIRQSVRNPLSMQNLTSLKIHPSSKFINERIVTFTVQAFYLGLFLIISMLAALKSYFDKRILYTYFSLFILFLGLFFPFYYGLLDDFVFFTLRNEFVAIGEIIFSGIFIFGFLFFSEYYQLKKNSPFHYWIYLSITFLSEISAHLMLFFIPNFEYLFHIRYFLSFLWLSATIYLTIRQFFIDKSKKYIFIGLISTMSLGVLVLVIGIFDPYFYDYNLYSSFQVAAFCFTAILFYDLFKWENPRVDEAHLLIDEISSESKDESIDSPQHTEIIEVEDEIDLLLKNTKSTDTVFLNQLFEIIEKNIENTSFSVEMLAKEVGYSRAHLNRKVKVICNISTNKLILLYRLNAAHKMLESGSYNVNEVAYKTGFSSTSYFVKCFGVKFGKTPGILLKE